MKMRTIRFWIGVALGGFSLMSVQAVDPSLFDGSEEEVTQTTNAPPDDVDAPLPENIRTGSLETENEEGKGSVTNEMEQVERPQIPSTVEPEAPVLKPLTKRTDLPPTEKGEESSEGTNAPTVNIDLEKFIPSENISSDAAVAFPVGI